MLSFAETPLIRYRAEADCQVVVDRMNAAEADDWSYKVEARDWGFCVATYDETGARLGVL